MHEVVIYPAHFMSCIKSFQSDRKIGELCFTHRRRNALAPKYRIGGKAEPYAVHEVCQKHKCIAKNVRISAGSILDRAGTSTDLAAGSNSQTIHALQRLSLRHLFLRDAVVSPLSPIGTAAPAVLPRHCI